MRALAAVVLLAVPLMAGDGRGMQSEPAATGQEKPKVRVGEPRVDPEKARQDAIDRARKYLRETLKAEAGEVELVSAEATTWPDASLGCPEKDRMYAQVVTPGYKVVLKVRGETHEVHVGRGRAVSCKAPG